MAGILITRSSHQASELADQLHSAGLEPVVIPAIEIVDPTSFATLDTALAHLETYHWLLFTSANAVEAFHRRWACTPEQIPQGSGAKQSPQDSGTNLVPPCVGTEQTLQDSGTRLVPQSTGTGQALQGSGTRLVPQSIGTGQTLQGSGTKKVPQGFSLGSHGVVKVPGFSPQVCFPWGLRIASIGPATARALESIGLTPTLIPPEAVAESLAQSLLPHARQPDGTPTRFLLIRAEQARDHLPDTLRSAGADLTIAPAYRTVVPQSSVLEIQALFHTPATYPDAITFTSSSSATNLIALLEASGLTLPPEIPRISIGPITTQTLRDLNLPPHAEADEPTLAALAKSVLGALELNGGLRNP